MTKQDFIFSTERKHQLVRHITFWVVWWLAYFLFFHLPQHAVFGWNLNEVNLNLRENGAWWILKMMIFNALLAVIVPQMIFTYTLIYFILPRYFYKRKNLVVTIIAVTVFIIAYFLVAGCFKSISQLPNYWMGLRKSFPWPERLSFFWALRDTLISLPIITGLALLIKLMERWWWKEKEKQQIASEKIKAELQLLKAQVHPHFLFNTLNNIYFFTLSRSSKAPEMIKRLSDLLNYILNKCYEEWVPLEREIKMIEDYVSLEKIRYGEELDLSVEFPKNSGIDERSPIEWLVAPLLLIPFVENSFKHGASKMLTHPNIKLRMSVEKNVLHFFITNSRPPEPEDAPVPRISPERSGKIGLQNVKKRLELLYPGKHELNIIQEPNYFTVYLNIQLHNITSEVRKEMKSEIAYEKA